MRIPKIAASNIHLKSAPRGLLSQKKHPPNPGPFWLFSEGSPLRLLLLLAVLLLMCIVLFLHMGPC